MRSVFKSTLKFGLIQVPLKAFSARRSDLGHTLNQLHEPCSCRIKYKKTCPQCGDVPAAEIIKGYEFTDGQYVRINPDDLKNDDRSITVEAFLKPDDIDGHYASGKTYWLAADGDVGNHAYHLLVAALAKAKRIVIARATIHGREELVRIRSKDGALMLDVLVYHAELRLVADVRDELGEPQHTAAELKMALQLISESPDAIAVDEIANPYQCRLEAAIQAKVDGNDITCEPRTDDSEPSTVINLMDALKGSLAASEKKRAPSARKRGKAKSAG